MNWIGIAIIMALGAVIGWYLPDAMMLVRSQHNARIERACAAEGRAVWLLNRDPVCMDVRTGALFAPSVYRPKP